MLAPEVKTAFDAALKWFSGKDLGRKACKPSSNPSIGVG
jgi:hypothetical protein